MHKLGKVLRTPDLPSNSISGRTDWYNCIGRSWIKTVVSYNYSITTTRFALICFAQGNLFHKAPPLSRMTKRLQPSPPLSRDQEACLSTTGVVSIQQNRNFKSLNLPQILLAYIATWFQHVINKKHNAFICQTLFTTLFCIINRVYRMIFV